MPAYPSSGDGGFAPITYQVRLIVTGLDDTFRCACLPCDPVACPNAVCFVQEIEPKFGTWADVESLAERYDLCLEFMVSALHSTGWLRQRIRPHFVNRCWLRDNISCSLAATHKHVRKHM